MAEIDEALALLPSLRDGDAAAQAEFCHRFEAYIRRAVRVRLRLDERLRRVLDSMDVCQEVLNSFLMRTAAGEYDLREGPQLLALLQKMLRNKLSKQRRWYYAERRTLGRQESVRTENWPMFADKEPSVLHVLAQRELLTEILARLDVEERRLAEMRAEGLSWLAIAQQMGGGPDALRMKLARALEKVVKVLDGEN
jgi:DNA-directed RNA polymerase specialized sigma24 family protein